MMAGVGVAILVILVALAVLAVRRRRRKKRAKRVRKAEEEESITLPGSVAGPGEPSVMDDAQRSVKEDDEEEEEEEEEEEDEPLRTEARALDPQRHTPRQTQTTVTAEHASRPFMRRKRPRLRERPPPPPRYPPPPLVDVETGPPQSIDEITAASLAVLHEGNEDADSDGGGGGGGDSSGGRAAGQPGNPSLSDTRDMYEEFADE